MRHGAAAATSAAEDRDNRLRMSATGSTGRAAAMLKARETKLEVEVEPGPGVSGYSLYVDGLPATMDAHHKGEVVCGGSCGDGSTHALLYSFVGSPGAALAVTLRCSSHVVLTLRSEIVATARSRSRGGRQVFAI